MKLLVEFGRDKVQEPAISKAVLETGIPVGIERAMIEGEEGWALLAVEDKDAKAFSESLKKHGISAHIQEKSVIYNEQECVDCGLCISLCMKHVFSFDENWKLVVNPDHCVLCGRCAEFCPQRALIVRK
ncbi:MAG TPA: 4Fe-4S binding protein [Methanocorpusculum sp.]|nr:4Fe-4S binding protein [Methanocorpusculum sp.]